MYNISSTGRASMFVMPVVSQEMVVPHLKFMCTCKKRDKLTKGSKQVKCGTCITGLDTDAGYCPIRKKKSFFCWMYGGNQVHHGTQAYNGTPFGFRTEPTKVQLDLVDWAQNRAWLKRTIANFCVMSY
jgi:hypothetical protein